MLIIGLMTALINLSSKLLQGKCIYHTKNSLSLLLLWLLVLSTEKGTFRSTQASPKCVHRFIVSLGPQNLQTYPEVLFNVKVHSHSSESGGSICTRMDQRPSRPLGPIFHFQGLQNRISIPNLQTASFISKTGRHVCIPPDSSLTTLQDGLEELYNQTPDGQALASSKQARPPVKKPFVPFCFSVALNKKYGHTSLQGRTEVHCFCTLVTQLQSTAG